MFGFVIVKGKWISRILSAVCAAVVFLTGLIFPPTYYPLNEERLLLNFTILSDTHVTYSPIDERPARLIDGLKDIVRGSARSDALVISGDLTENGEWYQYANLCAIIDIFGRSDNVILGMGNHEYYNDNGDDARKSNRFIGYTSKYVRGLDKVYYSTEVKGCTFIVLGSEKYPPSGVDTFLSDEQLEWFDATLAEAVESGKPVFVVNHQPINGTCRMNESWRAGGMGEQSDEVLSSLKKYDGVADIFFISGHLHNGLGFAGITNDGTLYFVDMPSFGKGGGLGYPEVGTGYQVEMYKDEIVFRARSFTEGEWLPEYDTTIPLIKEAV